MAIRVTNSLQGAPPPDGAAAKDWLHQADMEAARKAAEEAMRKAARPAVEQAHQPVAKPLDEPSRTAEPAPVPSAPAPSDPLANGPTSLATDDPSKTPNNCLTKAASVAQPGRDDIVFLGERAPAGQGVGHVVDLNTQTGQVTDLTAVTGSPTTAKLSDYLTQSKASGHDFYVQASAPAAEVQHILSLPADQRQEAIAANPKLAGIGTAPYADSGSLPVARRNFGPATTVSPIPGGQAISTPDDGTIDVKGGVASQAGVPPGAATQIARPDLFGRSARDVRDLTQGKTVQDILGSKPSDDDVAAVGDAYEMLGISNRQVSVYAGDAAKGGVGQTHILGNFQQWTPEGRAAYTALNSAAQQRAATDGTSQGQLSAGLNAPDPSTLPDASLSAAGLRNAVEAGIRTSGASSDPSGLAGQMLYGSQGSLTFITGRGNGLFKAIDANQAPFGNGYAAGRARGQEQIRSVTASDDPSGSTSLLVTPDDAARSASVALSGLTNTVWTPQSVESAILAGNTIMQDIAPDVASSLQATAGGSPAVGNYQSPAEQTQTYRDAVDHALQAHGIAGNARDIATSLLAATQSPAFNQALADGPALNPQATPNAVYNLIGEFDPQTLQAGALAQKLGGNSAEGQLARKLLADAAVTPAPAPSQQGVRDSAQTIALYAMGSLRYGIGAAAAAEQEGKVKRFGDLVKAAVQGVTDITTTLTPNAEGGVSLAIKPVFRYDGQAVGNTFAEMQKWALTRSGLDRVPQASQWFGTVGQKIASTIDSGKLGFVDTLSALGSLATRIQTGNTDPVTIGLAVADSLQAAAWITQPTRVAGIERGFTAIANAGSALVQNGWLPTGAGRSIIDAFNIPVVADPQTSIGKFLSSTVPAGTALGNGVYGGFKLYAGIKDLTSGKYVTGTALTATAVLDLYNALQQSLRAVGGEAGWQRNINSFGYAVPSNVDVITRLLASASQVGTAIYLGASG